MNRKHFLKTFLIATFALSTFYCVKITAANTVSYPATPLTISITKPSQSQVIVTEGFTVSGKAPAGVLITVTLQDEDYQKVFQVHEQNLITNATTTSDRNGDWVYIPSKNLVPGKYSVVAAFQNETTGSIGTEKIFFTVADDAGATSWFAIPGSTLIIIFSVLIIAVIVIVFRITGNKKRRIYLHTTAGDIPVREIVEDNIVEIVPLNEPMINIGTQQAFQVAQPTIVMPQPAYNNVQYQQPNVQQTMPVNNVIPQQQNQLPQQVFAPQQIPIQTVPTRPVNIVPVTQPQAVQQTQPQPDVQQTQQRVVPNIIQHPLVQTPNTNPPFIGGVANTQLT